MPYSGTFQKERAVVKSSPDALVYLNGRLSVPSGVDPNKRVNIQPLITDLSIQKSVENPPGSATINLEIPTHYQDDLLRGGYPTLTTMMEVRIYLKGFFRVGGAPRYYPAFWGVTTSTSLSYQGGQQNMTLSCEDMLYWWQHQKINIQPSVKAKKADISEDNFNVQKSVYTNKNPWEIIYSLSRYAFGDSVNADIYLDKRQQRSEPQDQGREKLMAYWTKRWGELRHALRMFGPKGRVVQGSTRALDIDPAAIETRGKETEAEEKKNTIYGGGYGEAGEINLSQMAVFEQVVSKIGSINIFDSTLKSKLAIANEVADATNFEFFQDMSGEIIFKPPFWNMDVIPNEPVSWVRPIDLIDETHNENVPEATMIKGTANLAGNLDMAQDEMVKPKASYVDYRLVQKFGWRPTSMEYSFFGAGKKVSKGNGNKDAPFRLFYHLIDELDRQNLNVHNGNVQIPLRPELRLGYPIFLEHRDSYYYIKEISHTFSYGGQCTTDLQLVGRRERFYGAFDSWGQANPSVESSNLPQPGEKAKVNVHPTNIHERPPDPLSGYPQSDENVNLVYDPRSSDVDIDTYKQEKEMDQAEKAKGSLVDMRTQFGIKEGAGTYVYQVDENKGNSIERYDEDDDAVENGDANPGDLKPGSPLTSLKLERVQPEGFESEFTVASFPVSDERGYEVIGTYEYGRSVSVGTGGIDFERNDSRVEQLLNMKPEDAEDLNQAQVDHEGSNRQVNTLKDADFKISPNNYGRRLAEIEPTGDVTPGLNRYITNFMKQFQSVPGDNIYGRIADRTSVSSTVNDQAIPDHLRDTPNQVGRWADMIERIREEEGISEEEIPTETVLSMIHVESGGDPSATNEDLVEKRENVKTERVGLMQVYPPNIKGVSETSDDINDYQGKNKDDKKAARRTIKQFFLYTKKHSDHTKMNGEYKPTLVRTNWHGGPGEAENVKDHLKRGASDDTIARELKTNDSGTKTRTDRYLAKGRVSEQAWRQRMKEDDTLPGPSTEPESESAKTRSAASKAAEIRASKAGGIASSIAAGESNQGRGGIVQDFESSGMFEEEYQDNLNVDDPTESIPEALPSDIEMPNDEAILPAINKYLKELYRQAHRREKTVESELRGEHMTVESPRQINTPPELRSTPEERVTTGQDTTPGEATDRNEDDGDEEEGDFLEALEGLPDS